MITEDYVSFEIAELLKEKGFEEECVYFYDLDEEDEIYRICSNGGSCNSKEYPTYFSMPTLQMAMKWLREVHHIHIYTIDTFIGFKYVIQDMFHHDEDIYPIDGIRFSSNEEAVEEAIWYCINNLI